MVNFGQIGHLISARRHTKRSLYERAFTHINACEMAGACASQPASQRGRVHAFTCSGVVAIFYSDNPTTTSHTTAAAAAAARYYAISTRCSHERNHYFTSRSARMMIKNKTICMQHVCDLSAIYKHTRTHNTHERIKGERCNQIKYLWYSLEVGRASAAAEACNINITAPRRPPFRGTQPRQTHCGLSISMLAATAPVAFWHVPVIRCTSRANR